MKKILKNKKGFTLVELIVVIAILGVLAVIMVPAFNGYIQKARTANDVSSAKSYCTAYNAYYADWSAQDPAPEFDAATLDGTWTAGSVPYMVDVTTDATNCTVDETATNPN